MCSRLKWLLWKIVGIQISLSKIRFSQYHIITCQVFDWWKSHDLAYHLIVTKMYDYWTGNGCHSKSELCSNLTLFYLLKIELVRCTVPRDGVINNFEKMIEIPRYYDVTNCCHSVWLMPFQKKRIVCATVNTILNDIDVTEGSRE